MSTAALHAGRKRVRRKTIRYLVVLASVLVLALPIPWSEVQASPKSEQSAWLASHAVPLETVEAGNGFTDLAPLEAMVGDARVVALGEGTHGTREYFQAKHRLLEYLVERLGFTVFSIEANLPEAYALNDYVNGADGDVDELIHGLYFWTWNTEEVRDLVEWMRKYNLDRAGDASVTPLKFTGFDMYSQTEALRIVLDVLERHDREESDALIRRAKLLGDFKPEPAGGSFGCLTASLPLDAVRGRTLRFSGWVRTAGLEEGFAGLWARVDGPTRKFDNMADRGVRGTTEWTRRSLEMEIPGDAMAVFVGLLMPGTGTSWFDGLELEIDGKPWTPAGFNLDFESGELSGLLPASPRGGPAPAGYTYEVDDAVSKSGERSVRLASVPSDPDALTNQQAHDIARDLLSHVSSRRDHLASVTSPEATEWVTQNARLVAQWTGRGVTKESRYAYRDRRMAENILWILEQHPEERMVVWAHNNHVKAVAPLMGSHLRDRLGRGYVNLAFCSSRGTYYAKARRGGERGVFPLSPPPPNSFEAVLESDGRPILLVDLRSADASDPGSAWLTEERPFGGWIGAVQFADHYRPTVLQGPFDLLLYVKETTPARQLGE